MGLWCTQALGGNLLAGVIAVDIDDEKLALAKKFGATHTINSRNENVAERISEITNGHMADFVIEGTGIEAVLESAFEYLRNAGRLVVMSSHEKALGAFDLRPALARGISITSGHPTRSANAREDMTRAVSLINNNVFRNEELITHKFKLEEINKAFETLENKPKGYIKGIVVM